MGGGTETWATAGQTDGEPETSKDKVSELHNRRNRTKFKGTERIDDDKEGIFGKLVNVKGDSR
jgi:hypothetical protein